MHDPELIANGGPYSQPTECGQRSIDTKGFGDSPWPLGLLSAVPDRNNPRGVLHWSIEEAIWFNEDLVIWELWKLRDSTTGVRKPLQTTKNLLSASPEPLRRICILGADVGNGSKKLVATRRREPNAHRLPLRE